MTDRTAHVLAILIVVCFFAVIMVVLFGFVDVSNPEIAKLVGVVFGYLTGVLNPIILRYFSPPPTLPPSGPQELRE